MQVILDHLEDNYDEKTKVMIINVLDKQLNTPILECIQHKSYETFEVLLMDGYMDLQAKDSDGKTAEELCAEDEKFTWILE